MLALPSTLGKDQADSVRALDQRPEGAYLSCESAGLPPYDVQLFTIERVNGDGSVSSIGLTQSELLSVFMQYYGIKDYSEIDFELLAKEEDHEFQRANAGMPQPVETPEKSPNTNA